LPGYPTHRNPVRTGGGCGPDKFCYAPKRGAGCSAPRTEVPGNPKVGRAIPARRLRFPANGVRIEARIILGMPTGIVRRRMLMANKNIKIRSLK